MKNTQWKPLAFYLLTMLVAGLAFGPIAAYGAPQDEQQLDEEKAKKENMKRLARQMESLTAYRRLAETSGITPQKNIPNIPQVPAEPVQVPSSR